jgi:hypothetical protein
LLVLSVPKCYRVPTFLEELTADVSDTGTVALECKVIGVPTPNLIWYKDEKELRKVYNMSMGNVLHLRDASFRI